MSDITNKNTTGINYSGCNFWGPDINGICTSMHECDCPHENICPLIKNQEQWFMDTELGLFRELTGDNFNYYMHNIKFISDLRETNNIESLHYKSKDNKEKESYSEHMYISSITLMALGSMIPKTIDTLKMLKMLLIHNSVKNIDEPTTDDLEIAKKVFMGHAEFLDLYLEWSKQETEESKTAKDIDNIVNVLTVILNNGRDWKENHITYELEKSRNEETLNRKTNLSNFLNILYEIGRMRKMFAG